MARSLFGGGLDDLYVRADASLGGALKAAPGTVFPALYDKVKWDGTRAVVTDFLVVNILTGATSAASSLTADANGYPPFFYAADGLTALYDVDGHRYNCHPDSTSLVLPAASESAAGVAEVGTQGEVDAGTDDLRIVTALKLASRFAAHNSDAAAHPAIDGRLDDLESGIAAKADLVGGFVPDGQIETSAAATPDKIAKYTSGGRLVVVDGAADNEAVSKLQATSLINSASALGAVVASPKITTGLPISSTTSNATFTAIPDIIRTDAASGQEWEVDYALRYRSFAAAGFQVRFKQNTSAATNKLANPSFETNTTNWTPTAACAVARATTGGGQDLTAYMTITAVTASNSVVTSEWEPATPGSAWSAGAYFKWDTGVTPKNCRVDIQFGDSSQIAISGAGTVLGSSVTPTTGAWTRSTVSGVGAATAPTGTAYARVRLVILTPSVSDVVRVDAVQLEPTATIPAYGSTGGGGSSALDITGEFQGLILTTPTVENFSRIESIRYPTVAGVTGQFGSIGTTTGNWVDCAVRGSFRVVVGGTGLTGQRIELEFAQVNSNAQVAQVVSGRATFAKVVG